MTASIALLARELHQRGLSQMSADKIHHLADFLLSYKLRAPAGDLVECGTWRGASACLIGAAFRGTGRMLHVYDSFEGMPAPTAKDFAGPDTNVPGRVTGDGGSFGAGSLSDTSMEDVRALLLNNGVQDFMLHKGFIVDAASFTRAPKQIALLHVDLDFYEPYRVTLDALYDRVSQGGVIIFDDYGHFPGAKRAVDEFLTRTGERLATIDATSRRVVIKGLRR